jgi:cell division protein FtsB
LTFAIVDGSNNMRSIYEKFRNVTNNTATFIADNKKLKADNLKLIHEVSQLNGNVEELEQYGRRTSLRFHNVPMVQGDLQKPTS